MLAAAALIAAFYSPATAAVSGPCVNCHTMHNSQGGSPMTFNLQTGESGPFGALVRSTCLGCHTTTDGDPYVGGYPYVKGDTTFDDDNCLAGGFFPTGTAGDGNDNLGKAHSLGSLATPPGYSYSYTWYKGTVTGRGLACAGDAGCHGSQTITDEMAAISGGHHKPTVYRILWAYNGAIATPVVCDGADDYEEALIAGTSKPDPDTYERSAATHDFNIYKAGTDDDTISKLCANCHGDYHSDIGSAATAWTRHPTDVELPSDFDPRNDSIVSDVDAKYNPFGFRVISAPTGPKYATCLSCHRAHGTGNYDLLRFGYNTEVTETLGDASTDQSAGSGNLYGCLGCHSKQRQ